MATRAELEEGLDKIGDENLEVVYRLVLALAAPAESLDPGESWGQFISSSYGCMADAPIERGGVGEFEARDLLR